MKYLHEQRAASEASTAVEQGEHLSPRQALLQKRQAELEVARQEEQVAHLEQRMAENRERSIPRSELTASAPGAYLRGGAYCGSPGPLKSLQFSSAEREAAFERMIQDQYGVAGIAGDIVHRDGGIPAEGTTGAVGVFRDLAHL